MLLLRRHLRMMLLWRRHDHILLLIRVCAIRRRDSDRSGGREFRRRLVKVLRVMFGRLLCAVAVCWVIGGTGGGANEGVVKRGAGVATEFGKLMQLHFFRGRIWTLGLLVVVRSLTHLSGIGRWVGVSLGELWILVVHRESEGAWSSSARPITHNTVNRFWCNSRR